MYKCPEVATMINAAGCNLNIGHLSDEYNLEMSSNMLSLQRDLESRLTNISVNEQFETKKPALILCDRGVFDFSAYIKPQVWKKVMTR